MSLAHIFSPIGNKDLVITQYQIGLTGVNSVAQGRFQQFVYPIRARQEPFKFQVQCRSQTEKASLSEFFRKHQQKSVSDGSYGGQLRFFWQSQQLDFLGYVKSTKGGAVRFQWAPTMDFELVLVKDLIYHQTNVSSTGGDWTGVYAGPVSVTAPASPPSTGGDPPTGWVWVDDPNGGGHWQASNGQTGQGWIPYTGPVG